MSSANPLNQLLALIIARRATPPDVPRSSDSRARPWPREGYGHRKEDPVAATAAVLLLLIAAAAVGPASASTLTLYGSLGCRRPIPGRCGRLLLQLLRGQCGRFYYGFNCQGRYDLICRSIRCCQTPCRYKSVFIPCQP
ncbi:unnamed protein product [Spirodela intermedia]|uniref:Uncharacterized protein n=1 Tax=Spirodela intermedia TaxID=51605 RepID=A0A7I8IL41_SPIIN|nr:unnamed protein product [Spirodela intermedia]CAA6658123.1 unnamed protein product [Spirodela intermedia]